MYKYFSVLFVFLTLFFLKTLKLLINLLINLVRGLLVGNYLIEWCKTYLLFPRFETSVLEFKSRHIMFHATDKQ